MDRDIFIKTTQGEDLLFRRMSGTEQMSRPYQYNVELLTLKENVALHEIIGQPMTVHLRIGKEQFRYFNGLVSRLAFTGSEGRYHRYVAVLRPWLWNLTRRSDCRIFQQQTIPDIIKSVFRTAGYSDFKESLSANYRTLEYCVQYRETDFNFVSRLMEQEGIYYFFEHADGSHNLVLADSINAHGPFEGFDELAFYPPGTAHDPGEPRVFDWQVAQEYQTNIYAHTDYDFKAPTKDLQAKAQIPRQHIRSDSELYDYPGEYLEPAEGDTYAKVRIEQIQSEYERCEGQGNVPGVSVGHLFRLTDHPRGDQNREYLTLACSHELIGGDQESDNASGKQYHCSFTTIASSNPYRPPRLTPKPTVPGPQTAIVVGPSGEEIWCDEYGRIKVQFHWDREGQSDENSSCWVRVAQIWAGKEWGGIHIPRITQEVIVEFLEGDPDRPIVTGSVYNADNMPPYSLAQNKTQAGIKTRSTLGGGPDNFNEIRFEDKKGEEQLYVHAERNHDIAVENDESHWVGHDRTRTVDNDESVSIGNDRSKNVAHDETITIGDNRTQSIGKDESQSVGANRTRTVAKDESVSVSGDRSKSVQGNESVTIGKSLDASIGENRTQSVGKNDSLSVGDNRQVDVGKNTTIQVGKKFVLEAGDSITLQTGQASITMKKDGTIAISGKDIKVDGSGKISIKAGSTVSIKGSKITQN